MSKTHFLQNKEVTVAALVGLGVLCMLVINIAVFVPTLYNVFIKNQATTHTQYVDTQTVDQALEYLISTDEQVPGMIDNR